MAQVSRNIAALESRLKMQLLYRSTRSVSLTEEGKLYLPHCQHLVEALREANQLIQQRNEQPQGLIRVTAPVYFGEQIIAPLLNDFMQQYDDLRLDLNLTNDTVDLVEGSYDLAIRLGHLGNSGYAPGDWVAGVILWSVPTAIFRRFGMPLQLEDLSQHRCFTGTVRSGVLWLMAKHKR